MKHLTLQRIVAMARKETLHIVRDPWSLAASMALPVLMLVLFGCALTMDVDRVPVIVYDQSSTHESREIVSRLAGSRYFAIVGSAEKYSDACRAIDRSEALLAVVIPRTFAQDVAAGRSAAIQVIADGSDSMTATLALGYADAVVAQYASTVSIDGSLRRNGRVTAGTIDVRTRVWYNPEMESRYVIVPSLIAICMMIIAALLTSLTVAREWEQGTMEQLITTPVRAREMVVGKLIPYFIIGMLDMVVIVAVGEFGFHVPMRGSLMFLFGASALFLIGVLAMGMVISIIARGQLIASQIAMVATFLPAFLLSGFMYPIDNMPAAIQGVTYAVPARYFVDILRGIYLKGVGMAVLWPQMTILATFSAAMLLAATMKFRKRLD
jgi:ABC-2 type transport system permease protein